MDNKTYIKEVMKYIHTPRKVKKVIKEDLELRINDSYQDNPYFNPINDLGSPEEYAKEFMENLEQTGTITSIMKNHYEYKSKMTLFGLPLIHINNGGSGNPKTAKGVIAIGDIATGIVSVGGVSLGLVSVGGVSIGAVSIGGVSIGGISLGGVSIGIISLGAVAYGVMKSFGVI